MCPEPWRQSRCWGSWAISPAVWFPSGEIDWVHALRMGQAWEQGGKVEADRWGVGRLTNLFLQRGSLEWSKLPLWSPWSQGEESCPVDPFRGSLQRGHSPPDPRVTKQVPLWPARWITPLCSALMGPNGSQLLSCQRKALPASQAVPRQRGEDEKWAYFRVRSTLLKQTRRRKGKVITKKLSEKDLETHTVQKKMSTQGQRAGNQLIKRPPTEHFLGRRQELA